MPMPLLVATIEGSDGRLKGAGRRLGEDHAFLLALFLVHCIVGAGDDALDRLAEVVFGRCETHTQAKLEALGRRADPGFGA
jgi:hypothetical protein